MATAKESTAEACGGGDEGQCALCGRCFKGKRGLGQHMKKAHPVEYNALIDVERKNKKWSSEEMRILAGAEIALGLPEDAPVMIIVRALSLQFADRSADSIKAKRRSPEYIEILRGLRTTQTGGPHLPVPPLPSSSSPSSSTFPTIRTPALPNRVDPPDEAAIEDVTSLIGTPGSSDEPLVEAVVVPSFISIVTPGPPDNLPVLGPVIADDTTPGIPDPPADPPDEVVVESSIVTELFDDTLDREIATVAIGLSTLIEESPPPIPPTPRIVFQRYRLGPADPVPDVSPSRLVLYRHLKCLFRAAPAAPDSSSIALDEAWERFMLDFDEESLLVEVEHALEEIAPSLSLSTRSKCPPHPDDRARDVRPPPKKKELRRQEFAEMQKLFKKSPKRVVEKILDPTGGVSYPAPDHFEAFWRNVMSLPPGPARSPVMPADVMSNDDLSGIWAPILDEELAGAFSSSSAAPGPDGIRPSGLRKIGTFVLLKLFNLFLFLGRVPKRLLVSRTIFIPKRADAADPGDFRPISMTSVITRFYHRILAKRLGRLVRLSEEQRAFRETDGASQNIFLLDLMLQNAKLNLKETHIASIDLVKAFDSVSHEAIYTGAASIGLPPEFCDYLGALYGGSKTILQFPGGTGIPFHPSCGVRQGDPLSPLLFNIVIEFLIRRLRSFIGISVDGALITTSAFADDLLFFSSTKAGLQIQLDKAVSFLEGCNLGVNAAKSFSISLLVDGRNKKLKIVDSAFKVRGVSLRALRPGDPFKYLGVFFRADGLLFFSPVVQMSEWLCKLAKAPLKPQQRLYIIRQFLIPKLTHLAVLSRIQTGVLKKTDRVVRSFLRRHLDLPHDALNAFFHAAIRDGGLGVLSFRVSIPSMRVRRLEAVRKCFSGPALSGFIDTVLQQHLRRASSLSVPDPNAFWRSRMAAGVDGIGLADSVKTPGQHNWIRGATLLLTGRDFINSVKLRFNALPCRSRCARGRSDDRLCRAGCNRNENLAHILQVCPRTHGKRIRRHDALINYAVRGLEQRGFVVSKEPRFHTSQGLLKPDLLATRGRTAYIIDAQVVSDQESLRRNHLRKVEKYAGLTPLVVPQFGVDDVKYHSMTLNWRGVWSGDSASNLLSAGLIRKADVPVLSSRAIIGGLSSFFFFVKSTQRNWNVPRRRRFQ